MNYFLGTSHFWTFSLFLDRQLPYLFSWLFLSALFFWFQYIFLRKLDIIQLLTSFIFSFLIALKLINFFPIKPLISLPLFLRKLLHFIQSWGINLMIFFCDQGSILLLIDRLHLRICKSIVKSRIISDSSIVVDIDADVLISWWVNIGDK